jgi:hypothetical protein
VTDPGAAGNQAGGRRPSPPAASREVSTTAPMIGPSEGPVRLFASRCSWCQAWASEEDEAAAKAGPPFYVLISHTICSECEARLRKEEEHDALD